MLKTKIEPKLRNFHQTLQQKAFCVSLRCLAASGVLLILSILDRPLFEKFAFKRHKVHTAHVAENLLLAVDGSSKGDNVR